MKDLPLWIIAGALTMLTFMLAAVIVGFIGYYLVVVPVLKEQRRQELIQREPWRAFE